MIPIDIMHWFTFMLLENSLFFFIISSRDKDNFFGWLGHHDGIPTVNNNVLAGGEAGAVTGQEDNSCANLNETLLFVKWHFYFVSILYLDTFLRSPILIILDNMQTMYFTDHFECDTVTNQLVTLEVELPYEPSCPSVGWFVGQFFGQSVINS